MTARLAEGPRLVLIGLVRVYQLVLSPHLGGSCRFSPTCSNYAIQALREYGAVRGSLLTAWRILRCNPFGKGGYDPPRPFGAPIPDEALPEPPAVHSHPHPHSHEL